jgi:hypothetical protein
MELQLFPIKQQQHIGIKSKSETKQKKTTNWNILVNLPQICHLSQIKISSERMITRLEKEFLTVRHIFMNSTKA